MSISAARRFAEPGSTAARMLPHLLPAPTAMRIRRLFFSRSCAAKSILTAVCANARGVDLNRNFPAANWRQGETVYRWNSAAAERDVVLLTGEQPGSERETQALCQLIHQIHPAWVVSFHDPLACIEDPGHSPLGHWLADAFSLPLVGSVGYDTPGSFGSWCADIGLPCITAEFPPVSADEATERYLPAMTDLLRWQA